MSNFLFQKIFHSQYISNIAGAFKQPLMLSIVGSVYTDLHGDTVHGARMTCDKYQANLCLSTLNLKKSCFCGGYIFNTTT